ncbi:hypothetical protein [Amycolatopsis sp. NPDC051128]|uniref:phospholipase D family protein n=1 Tax=Amycolatopsis sp. NPDC051128 TaxID=3155412 RepID=UPI003449ECA8
MLAPETRSLLTDALGPPDGYRVDVAVTTTFSLDLTALLLAPMSFALAETTDLDRIDPLRLLEAVRRYAERTTVFCQAGSIHVPPSYNRILAFAEDCVHEMRPPDPARAFHPKLWVVRFVDPTGGQPYRHRVLCLSRNLTFDQSWDVVLRLDEAETAGVPVAGAEDLAGFLRAMPGLALRALPEDRLAQVNSLADTIAGAALVAPDGFHDARFLPVGLSGPVWPFPPVADRVLVISPFLDMGTLRRLQTVTPALHVVSRPETFDRIADWRRPGDQASTLQRLAEVGIDEDADHPGTVTNEWGRVSDGLHAKTFVFDVGDDAVVVTGSANATGAGFGGNVEFEVQLRGPVSTCGTAAVLTGTSESPGLEKMLAPYTPAAQPAIPANEHNDRLIEDFHRTLAAAGPRMTISSEPGGRVRLRLTFSQPPPSPGVTELWPITLSDVHVRSFDVGSTLDWGPHGLISVTPFVAVRTELGTGDAQACRSCVLRAELIGDPAERRHSVLGELLRSKTDVLRYLLLLFADPSALGSSSTVPETTEGSRPVGSGVTSQALLEPMVRAAGRDIEALGRIESFIQDLRQLPDSVELMPEHLEEIWDVVWQVHQEVMT